MRFALLKISLFLLLLVPTSSVFAAPIKILLVPGHDNQIWGARYNKIKEADMTLAVATNIFNILKQDPRFDVRITRNQDGYTPEFAGYFASNQQSIIDFRDMAKRARQAHIEKGSFKVKESIQHNPVVNDTSVILYGINKWADENLMDAVVHVHFNDYPRKRSWQAGKYKGFAIYVPEAQAAHAKESANLAGNIFGELHKKYIPSNYPPEKAGIIADQSLIALGSNGTLAPSVRSVLIELGYIYNFGSLSVRNAAYPNMANLTALGIQNYFFPKNLPAS